ncbi:unnamed protein product [Orchesella dallaii]|uniref:Uncharacterized protein n=1 Tax=Orchesella dallaii TaxID=48710 RepID=A0ABP1RCZ3_9HEXA
MIFNLFCRYRANRKRSESGYNSGSVSNSILLPPGGDAYRTINMRCNNQFMDLPLKSSKNSNHNDKRQIDNGILHFKAILNRAAVQEDEEAFLKDIEYERNLNKPICRLRKATRKNQLEETLPYSDTSDLVPQRYSTLCGLKSGNTRQNGISILASEELRRFEKSRMSNFHLEKSPTPMIMTPSSGPPAYISATLPLPGKKKALMSSQMKVPMQWTPPPPYWIALPSTMAPPSTSFQYVGPYTTLPAVLKKQQKCRHEQLRNNGHHHVSSSSRRAIESSSSSPHHCMVVHNCGKKVQLPDDC